MKYKAFENMIVYILCIIYIFIKEVTIIKIIPIIYGSIYDTDTHLHHKDKKRSFERGCGCQE